MNAPSGQREQQSLRMMYGTYADILFVLFPFMIIAMQRLWDGDLEQILMRADLSIAATILAGLAIGKFVLGLVIDRELGRYKERIVFFIALTLFMVLGPAIILILSITSSRDLPGFIAFLQPLLLIVAISLYTTAVTISNILCGSEEPARATSLGAANYDGIEPAESSAPRNEPLAIPSRGGGDPHGMGQDPQEIGRNY